MKPILPGLGEGPRATWIGAGIVAALLVSRFALLPDGPWEQDEALFATGVLDYDVVHHRPHPPGFPAWIALGKLLRPLTGDALLSLRVWSSAASVLTVVVLAHLLARLVDARVALLCALAYAFAPVTWAHAPRAFSDTPALACVVVAIALWMRAPSARASLGAWALLGLAAAMRAQLAPELAVVALLGAWIDRTRWLHLLFGIATAIAVVAIAYGVAALDAESPAAYWHAVSSHLARHESDVPSDLAWADLGIVRGLGGSIPAAIVCGFALAGLGVAVQRDLELGAWLVALVGVTAWMVLGKHHPGFPRYAVTLLLAASPAIALAVARLPRAAPTIVAAAGLVLGALGTYPAMRAMQRTALPPVAALRSIAADEPARVVYSHGQFSFVRYASMAGMLDAPADDIESPDSIPTLPLHTYAIGGRTLHFLPGATVCIATFDAFPEAARTLSQERFDSTVVARDAILLGAGVHRPERTRDGDRFAWLSGTATLHVPGPSRSLVLQLRAPERQRVEARVGSHVVLEQTALDEGPHQLRIPLVDCDDGCAVDLVLPDARTAGSDRRRLSLRLESAWSEGPQPRGAHQRWSPADRASMRNAGVHIQGAFEPETFGGDHRGVWTHARFVATFPARSGILRLVLARPPHTPGKVVLVTEGDREEVEIGREAATVEIRVDPSDGIARVELETPTFVPRDVDAGSTDARALGAILFEAEYIPDDDPCGLQR